MTNKLSTQQKITNKQNKQNIPPTYFLTFKLRPLLFQGKRLSQDCKVLSKLVGLFPA